MRNNIKLRDLKIEDLEQYYELKHPSKLHNQYNGPYLGIISEEELKGDIEYFREEFLKGNPQPYKGKLIVDAITGELIGNTSYYWKSKETLWLEIGLTIFNEDYWNKGIGFDALTLWITEVFKNHPEIVRLGVTSWSGNPGMLRLAEKLGLQLEATYKKARIYKGKYYDSVSYGILREEWEQSKDTSKLL